MKRVLWLTCLMVLGGLLPPTAAADPLTRFLWLNVDALAPHSPTTAEISQYAGEYGHVYTLHAQARANFAIPNSAYLRVRTYPVNDSNPLAPTVWYSNGDGVYVSRAPIKQQAAEDYTDYFYVIEQTGARRIAISNPHEDPVSLSVYHSETVTLPDYTGDAAIQFDPSLTTTRLRTQTGYRAHDVQYVSANSDYSGQFEQPGLYHLELRVPWQARFQLSQLLGLLVTSEQPAQQYNLLAQLDTDTTYAQADAAQPQWLSRPIRVPFYVTQPNQEIRVQLDTPAYARWLRSDSQQQFLFQRNAPRAVEQQRHQQLALAPATIVDRVFHRALAPTDVMPTQQALALHGEIDPQPPLSLPYSLADEPSADYFYELASNASYRARSPLQSLSPPLRLTLLRGDQPLALTVSSDNDEQIAIRYWPELAVTDDWQLTAASRMAQGATARDITQRGTDIDLNFSQPYQQVEVTNHGTHAAHMTLAYRNQLRRPPTDSIWRAYVTPDSAQDMLSLLIAGSSASHLTHPVKYELSRQWHPRLSARAQQFAERYRGAVQTQQQLGDRQFAQFAERLSQQFQAPVTDINAMYQLVNGLGYHVTARRLVVAFAMGQAGDVQSQAEHLLNDLFRQQQRWFDYEGYWAWRLLHYGETRALKAIANSWDYQNRETEAAQLSWLWRQLPTAADADSALQPPAAEQLAALWHKLAPDFVGDTRIAMIYNSALDQYLSSFYLAAQTPLTARFEPTQQVKITLYPQVDKPLAADDLLRELTVNADKQRYRLAVRLDRISNSLLWSQQPEQLLMSPQTFTLTFEQPVSQVSLTAHGFNTAFTLEVPEYTNTEQLQQERQQTELTQQLSALALQAQNQQLPQARIAAVYQQLIDRPLTETQQFLLNQITADYGWQRLDTVASSDGIAYLDSQHWQARTAGSKLRRALMLTPLHEGERRLSYGQPTEVAVELQQPATLRLSLRLPNELAREQQPATINITTPAQQRQITVGHQPETIELPLAAGRHLIRLQVTAPAEGVLLYRLRQPGQPPLLPEPTIKVYRAQSGQPVQLFAPANQLIRIEQYLQPGQAPHNRYRWLTEDELLTLHHTSDAPYSYYRFFIWQPQPATEPEWDEAEQESTLTQMVAPDRWPQQQHAVFDHTVFDLDEQDDGTWGFDMGYRQRSNFDEDTFTPEERFTELGWNYQRRLADGAVYWDNSVRWREHSSNGLGTLVSENRLNWIITPDIDIEARLDGFYQAKANTESVKNAWSARAIVSGRWRYSWNYRTRNDFDISVFAWALSESAVPSAAIDDDIVTQYKLDHRHGLSISDTLIYQPWLDTRVHVGAELTLNEGSQGAGLDKWSINTGWRQYVAPWRFAVDARYRRYVADDNRRRDSSATLVGASIDYDLWQQNGNLWQLQLDFRHNFDRDASSAFIGISWNHTDGQGYDDFAPRRRAFSSLRRQHALSIIDANDITERADDH